jgi:tetratricopeptide (TPR) repeat protein
LIVSRVWFFRAFFQSRWPLWLVSVALLSLSSTASAQSDKAAAEALFREAMRLSKESDFKSACPKFEESLRLEPSLGAQYYLADCYEKVGRTASAWANFSEVADKERLAGDATKEKAARDRANNLEPKLSHLSVDVEDRTLPGLTVHRGDVAIGSGQWGLSVPVDPGSYVLQASAPGHKDWSKTVEVPNGAALTERIPALDVAPVVAAAPSMPPPAPPAAPTEPTPLPAPSHTQQTVGVVVLATGVVALGVSGVLALLAKSANTDSKRAGECTADNICLSRKGLDDRNRAVSLADATTVVSLVGAATAITGGVLWLTAPRSHGEAGASRATQFGLGMNSLLVRGSF